MAAYARDDAVGLRPSNYKFTKRGNVPLYKDD